MSKSPSQTSPLPPSSDPSNGPATGIPERSDGYISAKLDLLTSMMVTLAEKTNEALSEVAKLNDRISSQQALPTAPVSSPSSGFHLDSPKPPKGWKEGPHSKPKGEKKVKGAKSVTGPVLGEKDASSVPSEPHFVVLQSKKTGEVEVEERKERGVDDEVGREVSPRNDRVHQSPSLDLHRDDLDIGDARAAVHALRRESPSNRAARSPGGGYSNRSTLRSRTSMSSIDLNDVHEMEALNTVIKLNVGGRQFCTTRFTLTSVPGTMFEALLSGRHAVVRDADGAIFLDRDADIFEHVLTYLRDPRQLDLRYFSQQQQMRILCEMDYFMVPYTKLSRELPLNFTGHTLFIERENQWTMKWTNRGWWVGSDSHHHPSDGTSAAGSAASSSAQGIIMSATGIGPPGMSSASLKSGSGLPSVGLGSPPLEPPPALKFIDDLVYVNMKNRPIRAYDLWTGQCLKIIKDSYCDCFAVSSEHLVTYDADDQSLRLWNARTTAGICWIKADVPPTNVSCLSFVNDSMLVLGGDNNKCVTLNLPSAPDLQATTTTVLQGANLRQIEPLSPSVVAVGSTNGNIILWNIKLNVLLGTIPTAQQRITTIFARNNYVYCISPETIKVWDCSTNPSKPYCVATIFDEVYCLDAHEDLIVGITADRTRKSLLKVWSLSSSKLVHVMPIPAGETVHTIRVQENRIATILEDGTVLTWTINLLN